jgi:hypothetical protein
MAAKILVLDIETAPMTVLSFGLRNQNIGINQIIAPSRMIAFSAKWLGEKETFFYSEYHDPEGNFLPDTGHGSTWEGESRRDEPVDRLHER